MMVHLSAMLKKYFVKNNITCTTQTKTKDCFRYTIGQKLDCRKNYTKIKLSLFSKHSYENLFHSDIKMFNNCFIIFNYL